MKLWANSLLLLVVATGDAAASANEPLRPNLLVIVADDMGWGDLSVSGNTNLTTPHIDSLARQGASFERFFVQPVCSPTRAEFLTGRYHPRGGVRGVTSGGERLDLDERTIAETFRAAGYATGCFGKWHNGSQHPYHPNGRGFDEFYGFTSGHWGEYFNPPLDHNGATVRGEGYLADDITSRAVEFMRGTLASERPFFCYVAFNTPHSPMQVPDRHWSKFQAAAIPLRGTRPRQEDMEHTRAALAMCENLDENVGRLLEALDRMNAARETIVVFFSDNGPNGARWNGGMRGVKGSTDEGGVRSPLLVRWPERIPPKTVVEPIAGTIDLYPTLAALAGVTVVTNGPLDGVDVSAQLVDADQTPPDRMLFQHWGGKTSARSQQYRLDADGRLYDMLADPGQRRDIAAKQPAEAERMRKAVQVWRYDVLAELPAEDDRPFPVGHTARPITVFPARDGQPRGGVERSAAAPNCSYFTHWTSPNDSMAWPVEVLTAGRYEAVVDYSCPQEDVGAELELAIGGASWKGKVNTAHDPPLRGMEHDRVPRRSESYVKDFRPQKLGVAELSPGRGDLILRATLVPGKQVADVRAVTLRRLD
jgi:arylsulfatase A-like enzyme